MEELSKNIFSGGVNTMVNPQSVNPKFPDGDILYSLNTRSGNNRSIEGRANISGNTKVNYTLPEGINKVVGRYEDRDNERLIYLLYNSNGNHKILSYNGNTIDELASGDVLGFDKNRYITSIGLENGKLLYWSDAQESDGTLIGNPPYCLNIERSNLNKKLSYKIYAGKEGQSQFGDGNEILLSLIDPSGITIINFYPIYTVPQGSGFEGTVMPGLTALADNINNDTKTNYLMTAEVRKNYVLVTMKLQGDYELDIKAIQFNMFTVADNFIYNQARPLEEFHILRQRQPPLSVPTTEFRTDNNFTGSRLAEKYFQFACRYIYYDNEKTAIGDISKVATEHIICSGDPSQSTANYIRVTFTDDLLNDKNKLCMIKQVEILFRESNNDVWQSAKVIDVQDIGLNYQFFDFYNDGNYRVLGSSEGLHLQDWSPEIELGMAITSDRIITAGYIEGKDNIDVNASTEVIYEDLPVKNTWSVKGKIRIHRSVEALLNTPVGIEPIHDPLASSSDKTTTAFGGFSNSGFDNNIMNYKQNLPEGGFVVYLAGTDKYAVSEQNVPIVPSTGSPVPTVSGKKGVYDSSTTGNRSLIREVLQVNYGDDVYSSFEIKDVPPGYHILRIASHNCSLLDVLSLGDYYNLTNSKLYQHTSTYLTYIEQNGVPIPAFEVAIYLDSNGGVYNVEDIWIMDLCGGPSAIDKNVYDGYVIDGDSDNPSIKELQAGRRIELARITAPSLAFVHPLYTTDHNGFFFCKYVSYTHEINISFRSNLIVRDVEPIYQGELQDLMNDTLTITPEFKAVNTREGFIVPCMNVLVGQECLTNIKGTIQDQNGNGIPGLTMIFEGTGRIAITDSNGDYSLAVYVDKRGNPIWGLRRDGYLDIVPLPCITLTYNHFIVAITQFAHNSNYSVNFPYVLSTHQEQVNFWFSTLRWKHRTIMKLGIEYEDIGGRKWRVQNIGTVSIPLQTESGQTGIPIVKYNIGHLPPEGAVKYQIVATENQFYNTYLQIVSQNVLYVVSYDNVTLTPTTTTYSAGDANEIWLSLKSISKYIEEHTGTQFGYVWTPGDRLTFLRDSKQSFYTKLLDFKIEALNVDSNGEEYAIIKYNTDIPELKGDELIEIYTPKSSAEEDIYYSIGEKYDIAGGYHLAGANGQDQTATQDATGYLREGNTWQRYREMATKISYLTLMVESPLMYDDIQSGVLNWGWTNITDKYFQKKYFKQRVRFSEKYIGDFLSNRLSTFQYSNFLEINEDGFGSIQSITPVGNLLLAVMAHHIQPIYTGEREVYDMAQGKTVGKTSAVLTMAMPLREDWGTVVKESIITEQGHAWGFDIDNDIVWQYNSNGLERIEGKFAPDIKAICDLVRLGGRVIGEFDRDNRELVWTVPPFTYIADGGDIDNPGRTIAYNIDKKIWEGDYGFIPEMIGKLKDNIITFKNGELYAHGSGYLFYGNGYSAVVVFPVIPNGKSENIRTWETIKINADSAQWDIDIEIPPNELYPNGMKSSISKSRLKQLESDIWGEFLRDINDPHFTDTAESLFRGRKLKGRIMIITMTNSEQKTHSLREVTTLVNKSMFTI